MTQQAQVNEGWEERYHHIRENFYQTINTGFLSDMVVDGALSASEATRAQWKIKLLEPFVTRLVVNMIKGTIKYTSDDWSEETWQDMGRDDKADSINYDLLFQDWMRERGYIT
jgi:hypothetical protein